jgi:hypothetical protein
MPAPSFGPLEPAPSERPPTGRTADRAAHAKTAERHHRIACVDRLADFAAHIVEEFSQGP